MVRQVEPNGRVALSHKELLGSWEENAALFSPGETVAGVIRSSESYGVFIELTPNLAGLAEPRDDVFPGQHGQRIHQKPDSRKNEGKADFSRCL